MDPQLELAIRLTDPYQFDSELRKLSGSMTQREAYRRLEQIFQHVFHRRRYSSFDSWRSARNHRYARRIS